MNKEEHSEKLYQLSINIAKRMYEKELITLEELKAMNCILLEKYHPTIGALFSLKDLIS